ncbi:hypothetical protein LOTGIDRAFT_231474 [Lottia gigantea]|uniref:Uncharacterized protein n=1 Tax=Lottia gigantea TaxID=225164 RepID=V4C6G3_LOTGI|nr:hypothetical protein LOTGIDRAFT_231474 [Lottia gigantea]ESO97254.1 hypothetical protein LOTGIDRAFT_231474 [Lottia gigantea]
MAGNRDIKYPVGQPGFSNMMSGSRQFVQPGMTFHPLIQQPLPRIAGGIPQSPQQMFPLQGQSFQMAPRRMAPPSYNQHISQNFVRNRPAMVVPTRPPPSQKDIQFQIQQQRLKQFGQTKHVKADADKFIESMFGKTEKPKGRMDRHLVTVSTAQPPASSSHSTASSSHVSISQQSTPTIQPSMSHTSSDNPGQVNAKRIGQGPAVRKDPHEPRLLSYPETKVTIICHNSLPSSAQSVPEDDGFGDFLQGPMTSSTSKPPDASPASASVVTDNTHPNPASVQPDTSTVTTSKPPEQKKDESGSETSEKTVILPADSPSLQTTTTVSPPKIPRLDIDPEYDIEFENDVISPIDDTMLMLPSSPLYPGSEPCYHRRKKPRRIDEITPDDNLKLQNQVLELQKRVLAQQLVREEKADFRAMECEERERILFDLQQAKLTLELEVLKQKLGQSKSTDNQSKEGEKADDMFYVN